MGKFDDYINVTAPLHSATTKGKLGNANEIFTENDEDNVQNIINKTNEHIKRLDNRSSQMEESIKNISVTGGASVAEAVTYDNTNSGLESINVKGAIDEITAKNKEQDITIGNKAEKSEMATELNKKFNKENISQEFGDSEDKVVSQFALPFREIESPEFIKAIVDAEDHFLLGIQLDGSIEWGKGIPAPIRAKLQEIINQCQQDKTDLLESINTLKGILDKTTIKDEEGIVFDTPFRYIQNEEFIFAKVDAEDRLLFGIEWDGTPKFGKTSAVEDRLQSQVTLLAEKVATIMGDEDTTNVIDTMNELKKFFAEIENTQTLTSILENLNEDIKNLQDTKVDKEEGKSLIEYEIKECFRIIENEEFIKAIVDAEGRVLLGFYRATGKPYYPLNEMYHVIQNEEYFAAWVTTDDKVALGIRRDGEIIGEIHAVNALKQVIYQIQSGLASLQEKVGTIDTNLKELLDIFSLQENPEYMAVETDAEGKILSSTNADGSHYIHNAKSETIPEEFSHIEDPEGRTEITTDAENKILGYRDSEGTRHEHKISVTHINLSDDAAKEVNDAFKSAGIKTENPSDFSNDSYVELPIPRIAAQVRLYAPKLPTTKQDDIKAEIEYNDKDGNYFRKPVILNAQGSSSMNYYVKNMAIDINDNSKIKFGDFPTQDSFHLKKYYIDIFRGQCIVGYWLMEQVYQTRPVGKRYPYEMLSDEYSPYSGKGKVEEDFYSGAKCHPDGFPIIITWVNTQTGEEKEMGIYAWNLKKAKEVYHANKKKAENIILDGYITNETLFGGNIDWTQFEIRNPKSLIDIDGNKYDGDNPKELSETDENSKKVKDYLHRLSGVRTALSENNTKETFAKYFIVDTFIDYYIVSQILYNLDGFAKNWIWCTWDGEHWTPTLYDVDSIFGSHWNGTYVIPDSDNAGIVGGSPFGLMELYPNEVKTRYKELRDSNIFSVGNIISLLEKWLNAIGYSNIEKEISIYPDTPSYRDPLINNGWALVGLKDSGEKDDYNSEKTYSIGDLCIYSGYKFKSITEVTNIPPLKNGYEHEPKYCGYYNSIKRVSEWLSNRLVFLDTTYEYNV